MTETMDNRKSAYTSISYFFAKFAVTSSAMVILSASPNG